MKKIHIQTAQNVTIDYEPADVGERILAGIIDGLIIAGITIGLFLLPSLLRAETRFIIYNSFTFAMFVFAPSFFYHLVSEIWLNGQSLGKRQRKIKVIRMDGTSPRVSNYFLRWFIRPIDTFFFGIVAIITIAINGKGQRLGDLAASTTVVKIKPQISLDDILAFENIEDEHYQPVFLQATLLSDNDINVIKDTLRRYKQFKDTEVLLSLTKKVKTVLKVDSKMPPVVFLKTIIKDFTYLTAESEQEKFK